METRTIAGYIIIFALVGIFCLLIRDIGKSKLPALWYSLLFGLPIFFFLSFHIIPSRHKVFPKDNFTFSNTFIMEDDISDLIRRYNDATFFEKASIRNEPLARKLIEKGIIEASSTK